MKVSETQMSAVTAASPRAAQTVGQQKEAEAVQDKVTVSSSQETAAVEAAAQSVSSSRSARVQEIIRAVQSGQYYPSPQQIAQQLVSEAEVEARMRAMMAK